MGGLWEEVENWWDIGRASPRTLEGAEVGATEFLRGGYGICRLYDSPLLSGFADVSTEVSCVCIFGVSWIVET